MIALSIGQTTYDINLPIDSYPLENGKYYLKEKFESVGGGAAIVACLLAKWNVETYFSSVVGYDEFGTSIKKEMEKSGIKTSFLETIYDKKTSSSFILMNQTNHSHTIFNIQPEEYHLKKYEYDMNPDVIYLDGYEYSATMAAINKYQTAKTIFDASIPSKQIITMARTAKYLVCSLEFVENIAGMRADFNNPVSLLTIYKRVKDTFPNNEIIITLKQYGALYCMNKEVKVMPPLNVAEVDRTGVGDIFRGAFTYAIGQNYDIEKCVRIANIAAGLSTTKRGGKDSIPLLSEVIQNYESRFGSINPPEIQQPNSSQVSEPPKQNTI
ncbi:MAG: carbohydrate kinase family protein [Bacilli bacterium]|jgi:ribokinase|nr:carbohydrate kinase family protein [Bacilli bacterium]